METNNNAENLIKVRILTETTYNINPVTKEVSDVVNKILETEEVEFGRKRRSSSPAKSNKDKITIDIFASITGLPIAYIRKSSIKLTREAANVMGVLNENGEIYSTPQGKNVRIKITYAKDSTTKVMVPAFEAVFNDNSDKLPSLADNLTFSCIGRDNDYLSTYGMFYLIKKSKCEDISIVYAYDSIEELANSNGVMIPEEFVMPSDSLYAQLNKAKEQESESEKVKQEVEADNDEQEQTEQIPEAVKEGIENDEELGSIIGETIGSSLSDTDDESQDSSDDMEI